MKVYLKNKLISIGGDSVVKNEAGDVIFKVDGKAFSITKKKYIYDAAGNKLYRIRNKYWRWLTHRAFIDDASGDRIATVKSNKYGLRGRVEVEDYPDEIRVDSKPFSLERTIYRNGELMGKSTSRLAQLADNFMIEADEKDIPFLVALYVAIDNILDLKSKEIDRSL